MQTFLSTFNIQVQYLTSTSSWALIPDADLPGNSIGTTTSPVDISNLNYTTYGSLKLKANFTCSGATCPTLNDWTLAWSQGVHVSGTAKAFDQTTNVTSGTAQVAVNGTLQAGKTATIAAGVFDIPNVTAFTGDIITVFIDGANDANEAVAIGARVLWMQLGVMNEKAARIAADAGLAVVMNRCVKIEHARVMGGLNWAGVNTGVISSKRGLPA